MKPRQIPLTLGLIAFSILIYLLYSLWDSGLVLTYFLISLPGRTGLPEIFSGQIWRLISPIFLHFSVLHIGFNMLWVYMLGGVIEIRQGKWLLLLMVISTAIISNLIQYLVEGYSFGGMSGVVYALFGYVWMQGLTNDEFGVQLQQQLVIMMLGWFVVCWSGILELFGLFIANTAHTAGLVSGIILSILVTLLLGRWRWRGYRPK